MVIKESRKLMNIVYIVSKEMIAMGYNDEQGRPLFATDFVIVDQDRIVDGKPFLLDDWKAVYHLDDKQYEIDQQVENAEYLVNNLKKYIRAFQIHRTLLNVRKAAEYENSGMSFNDIEGNSDEIIEMENELDILDDELITVRCALAFHKQSFHTVDENWIAENMVNDGCYVMGREYLFAIAEEMAI